jgi:signal transduction histidine kinase
VRRVVLAYLGVEVLFKLLVGYGYLVLAAVRTPAERDEAIAWYVMVALPFTTAFFVSLVWMLAPVRAWFRAREAGSDELLQRAAEALCRLPSRSAWLWTIEWGGTFTVLAVTHEVTCFAAAALFVATMITGPQPVARGIAAWMIAPSVRQLAIAARERGVALRMPATSLRGRLAAFGMLIAITPTTYLASFAFSAQVLHLSVHDLLVPVMVVCITAIAFAVICAVLTATSVTDVVALMAEVIREVARQGDVTKVDRVPQQIRDEVGQLAGSINEMIDRLERTAAERAAMSESLELLNQALELRVLERTKRLFEANAVLHTEMAARSKAELELRHAQKLEAVGRLSAGIAHEINTPVQFVSDSISFVTGASDDLLGLVERYRAAIQWVRAGAPADQLITAVTALEGAEQAADFDYIVAEIPNALALARDGLDRVRDIIRSMKTFAHNDQHMRDSDLNQAILSTLTIAHHEYKYVADVDTDLGELPPVFCHAGEVNQVVLNLLVNAAHAITDTQGDGGARGRIGVRTSVDGDDVVIAISDTGGGIPDDIQSRIFEPFFTTKGADRGTGQGLAIARTVVAEKHGGTLTFTTERGKGTTFFIRLPIRGKQAEPVAAPLTAVG